MIRPGAHDAGAYGNGWRYVLVSRLRGESLAGAWFRAPHAERERVVAEIGEALAAPHCLDPGPLGAFLVPGDWSAFVDRQQAAAVERLRGHRAVPRVAGADPRLPGPGAAAAHAAPCPVAYGSWAPRPRACWPPLAEVRFGTACRGSGTYSSIGVAGTTATGLAACSSTAWVTEPIMRAGARRRRLWRPTTTRCASLEAATRWPAASPGAT